MTDRLDLEREILAAVLRGGVPVLLALRRTPWDPSWLTGPRRLAVEAAETIAMRGEAITADAITAEVERLGGDAQAVRDAALDAVELYGGVELGRIEELAGALADVRAAEAQAGPGDEALAAISSEAWLGRLERTIEEKIRRLPSGFARLDAKLGGGLGIPSLNVTAAPPKALKSTLAEAIAENQIRVIICQGGVL